MAIKKVLVPTDFSDAALQALDYTVELARPLQAHLIILFVVEPANYGAGSDLYSVSTNLSLIVEEQQRIGAEQLSRLGRHMRNRAIRFHTLVETGTPHRVIAEVAERLRADLIVMATHGRRGFSHLLMGSVTEKVIRTAPCPVLTMRAHGLTRRRPKRRKRKT